MVGDSAREVQSQHSTVPVPVAARAHTHYKSPYMALCYILNIVGAYFVGAKEANTTASIL